MKLGRNRKDRQNHFSKERLTSSSVMKQSSMLRIRAEPPNSCSLSLIALATNDLPEPGIPRIIITMLEKNSGKKMLKKLFISKHLGVKTMLFHTKLTFSGVIVGRAQQSTNEYPVWVHQSSVPSLQVPVWPVLLQQVAVPSTLAL